MRIKSIKIESVIKKIAIAALSLLFVFIWTSGAFGWFEKEDESEPAIEFGSMEIASRVYFEYRDASNNPVRYYPEHDGYGFYYVKVMSTERNERDYIGNLRIDVYFKGIVASYIRIFITETWFRYNGVFGEDEILRNPFTRYTFDDSLWIDNRKKDPTELRNDGHFYYNDINSDAGDKYEISYRPQENDPGYMTVPLVTGVGQSFLDTLYPQTGTKLKIKVLSKAVQVNRYLEIWDDIDSLPAR